MKTTAISTITELHVCNIQMTTHFKSIWKDTSTYYFNSSWLHTCRYVQNIMWNVHSYNGCYVIYTLIMTFCATNRSVLLPLAVLAQHKLSYTCTWWLLSCLTHWRKMSTKRGLYDISYHNSWYRSRKIKEDSSTEREKSPPSIWAYIYHSPMYESIAGFFLIKMIKKSSNWQCF